ncbi:hypothetical protein [Natronomonas marina]|uniref:hypothetical protein n=1 Tax=Natronomonas marina TaxID=2961939 RepID=UPI0020C98D23|nr:hypothetical protein [Natronomonas marina]
MTEGANGSQSRGVDGRGHSSRRRPEDPKAVPFESRWHLAAVGTLAFGGSVVVLIAAGRPEPLRLVGFAAVFGTIVCSLLSLFAYRVEAKRLRAADADWRPVWWAYVLAHLLLSPFFVTFVYLLQRWRHVGLGTGIDGP